MLCQSKNTYSSILFLGLFWCELHRNVGRSGSPECFQQRKRAWTQKDAKQELLIFAVVSIKGILNCDERRHQTWSCQMAVYIKCYTFFVPKQGPAPREKEFRWWMTSSFYEVRVLMCAYTLRTHISAHWHDFWYLRRWPQWQYPQARQTNEMFITIIKTT